MGVNPDLSCVRAFPFRSPACMPTPLLMPPRHGARRRTCRTSRPHKGSTSSRCSTVASSSTCGTSAARSTSGPTGRTTTPTPTRSCAAALRLRRSASPMPRPTHLHHSTRTRHSGPAAQVYMVDSADVQRIDEAADELVRPALPARGGGGGGGSVASWGSGLQHASPAFFSTHRRR